uniref:Uncharacterized protein n=1 Tax=Setaria viridis TaxID=4556 RepID=A0A4U6U5J8_SETVI|nr:hypothetical protein SEVIR_6G201100v2 [Setaria viridis]
MFQPNSYCFFLHRTLSYPPLYPPRLLFFLRAVPSALPLPFPRLPASNTLRRAARARLAAPPRTSPSAKANRRSPAVPCPALPLPHPPDSLPALALGPRAPSGPWPKLGPRRYLPNAVVAPGPPPSPLAPFPPTPRGAFPLSSPPHLHCDVLPIVAPLCAPILRSSAECEHAGANGGGGIGAEHLRRRWTV